MPSLTFTLIQTNLIWEDKPANLQMLEHKIRSINEKTEVVILPEMFTTGFSMKPEEFAEAMDGDTVNWMKNISAEKKVVVTGSLMIRENGNFYNRMIWMLPNGQYGYYDKRHLFAMGDEHNHYTAGNKRVIAQVKGWKINLQVCYDLRFPVWARQAPSLTPSADGEGQEFEYDVLLYVANWPEKRNHAWKTLLQARAVENQSFAIGVNRVGTDGNDFYHSGDSMVVNPMGEVIYTKAHDEDVFTITLHKNEVDEIRTKLPFWKDADPFKILE
jgi:predicted amidohydrolase